MVSKENKFVADYTQLLNYQTKLNLDDTTFNKLAARMEQGETIEDLEKDILEVI